jgi:hypothetical protein
MRWQRSWRADPSARRIADGHYTRQNPDSDQFVPPGRCVVLVIPDVAYWVTSWPFPQYVKHAWPGAWVCSAFRQERRCSTCDRIRCVEHPDAKTYTVHRSSDLIIEALAATKFCWAPPPEGMITFVDESKVLHKRDPGRCFRKAGFHISGELSGCSCAGKPDRTAEDGLLAFHLAPDAMPSRRMPLGAQMLMEWTL